MNLFSITPLIISIFLFSLPSALAAGSCKATASVHESFCSDKSKHLCEVHSGVCQWKESKTTVELVIKKKEKSCTAKVGHEAHESFCKGHQRQECIVHSTLCSWQ